MRQARRKSAWNMVRRKSRQSLSTTPISVGWNQIQNTVGFDISQAAADPPPAAAPATLSPQDPTVSRTSNAPLNYFVRFTLSDGSVFTVNEGQFFALEGFSFSDQQTVSIGSQSSGAGAGKVTFNPLQLTLSQVGLQPALFQALASGTPFQEVDVLGYSQGSNELVTDDSFGLVFADNLSTDASGATQVSLEYGSEEIQQSLSTTPISVGWNQIRTVGFDISQAAADPPADGRTRHVEPARSDGRAGLEFSAQLLCSLHAL